MDKRKRLGLLIIQVATLALIAGGGSLWFTYRVSLSARKQELEAIASRNVALIDALLKMRERKTVLFIIREAYLKTSSIVGDEEILIGESRDGELACLALYGGRRKTCPNIFKIPVQWGAPLRQALQQKKGVMVALDQNGEQVVSAYRYIPETSWGIVAQFSLRDFQAPFWKAWYVLIFSIITFEGLGILIFFKTNKLTITQDSDQEQAFLADLKNKTKNIVDILENSGNVLIVLDSEARIVFVNKVAEGLLGMSKTQLSGTHFIEFMADPRESEELINCFETSLNDFNLGTYRSKILGQGNQIIILDWVITVILDDNQKIRYFIQSGVNITDKIATEEKLLDIQKEFQVIFESSDLGIGILDEQGMIIKHNQKLPQLLGSDDLAIDFFPFFNLLYRQYQTEFNNAYRQVVLGNRHNFEQEISSLNENHIAIDILVNVVSLTANKNSFEFAIVLLKDITPYKSIEKDKVKLIDRNQSLIEALGEIVYIHDLETDKIEWQGNYQTILGYDQRAMGNNGQARRQRIHPEDFIRVQEEMENAWSQRRMFDLEYRFQKSDGQYLWFHDRGVVKAINHQPTEISGVMLDISQRKQLEEESRQIQQIYQQFMDTTAEGIWMIDREGRTTFVNQTMADALGYSLAEMLGKSFLDFMRPEDAETALKKLSNRLEGASEVHDFCFLHRDSSEIWFLIATNSVRDNQGEITGALGMFTNITEKKRMEIDLRISNEKLNATIAELEKINANYALLNNLNDFLQACKTKEEAYQIIPQFLQKLFPTANGAIFELNAETQFLRLAVGWGAPNSMDYFYREDCWALRRNRVYYHICQDSTSIACAHKGENPDCQETLCIPLVIEGKQMGLLFFCSSSTDSLNQTNQQLAKTVGESIALTLGNLNLNAILVSQSIKDSLTGLYNRRYWEEALKKEIQRAKRNQQPLTAIMIDIDHFKQLNDRWGHHAGDVVLIHLSKLLREYFRQSDLVCRYGGEEFLVILPNASLTYAYERTETFRQMLNQQDMAKNDPRINQVTASFGLACFPDQAEDDQDLLHKADQALYQAKKQGRDRVVIFGAAPDQGDAVEPSIP